MDMSDRPHRLPDFPYVGRQRYSLTFCTHQRRTLFKDANVVEEAVRQILRSARSHDFAIVAYCFMPDHLHLLVEGQSDTADLIAVAHAVKQRIAYQYRRTHDITVWQKGYYERVLRDDEATLTVAKYVLENPVRAGLVAEPQDYPFSGSFVWTWDHLTELWESNSSAFGTATGTP
jgi:putative transposase